MWCGRKEYCLRTHVLVSLGFSCCFTEFLEPRSHFIQIIYSRPENFPWCLVRCYDKIAGKLLLGKSNRQFGSLFSLTISDVHLWINNRVNFQKEFPLVCNLESISNMMLEIELADNQTLNLDKNFNVCIPLLNAWSSFFSNVSEPLNLKCSDTWMKTSVL